MAETYRQLREILDDVRGFHEEAAVCCVAVEDASDERTHLLTRFFRDRERHLTQQLKTVEDREQADVLGIWVQFVPADGVNKALRTLRSAVKEGADTTFAKCLGFHEELVVMFRHLAEILPSPESQRLMQDLADMEEQAMHQLGLADTTRRDG